MYMRSGLSEAQCRYWNTWGLYTHKAAITTHRILQMNEQAQTITFAYKDYHQRGTGNEKQQMTLSIEEFTRRFEQHILPMRYTKIRHYGYLTNYKRREHLEQLFASMSLPKPPPRVRIPIRYRILERTGVDILLCPECKQASMSLVATYYRGILCKTYEEEWHSNKAPP